MKRARYRPTDDPQEADLFMGRRNQGDGDPMWLKEDTTLQDIVDEWAGSWQKEIRELSPELADLLDGIT